MKTMTVYDTEIAERGIDDFFHYAQRRYSLHLRKLSGEEKPWTGDRILQQFRFCNIFREDDKTTRWIRANINYQYYGLRLVGALTIARWFNRIGTLEKMIPGDSFEGDLFRGWNLSPDQWEEKMRSRLKDVKPLITGAYLIKTPTGLNKLDGLLWSMKRAFPLCEQIARLLNPMDRDRYAPHNNIQFVTERLSQAPFLGLFMSYEIATDLRHTELLHDAQDIMTWANSGPGAARGLGRVIYGDKNIFGYTRKKDKEPLLEGMRWLLEKSKDPLNWPEEWPSWELREVEHTLCEFDKYTRVKLNEGRPRQLYKGV